MTDTDGPSNATLGRIRALLAKAEGTSYPEEAETYRNAALALMAKHQVDEAVLGASAEDDTMGVTRIDVSGGKWGAERAHLIGCIARPMNVYTLRLTRPRRRNPNTVEMYGRAADRARVELLYTSLLLQASAEVETVRSEHPSPTVAETRGARSDWLRAFAGAIENRLTSAVKTAASGTGAALVLADRLPIAEAFARGTAGPIGKARKHTFRDASAIEAGRLAGERADLDQTRLHGRAHRSLDA